MDETGHGALKLVVADGDLTAAEAALGTVAPMEDVRRLTSAAWVVYTDLEPAAIRDRVAAATGDGVTVLVVEFERWSAFGEAVDRAWLLRRGH